MEGALGVCRADVGSLLGGILQRSGRRHLHAYVVRARSAGRSLHGRGRAARGRTYGVLNACMLAAAVVCVSVFAACGAGYYQPNTGQTGCLGTLSCALDVRSPACRTDARSIVHYLAALWRAVQGCTAGTQSSPGSASCTSTWMHAPTPRRRRPSLVFFYTEPGAGAGRCTDCAAGSYSGPNAGGCSVCGPGTYSGGGASSCTSTTTLSLRARTHMGSI